MGSSVLVNDFFKERGGVQFPSPCHSKIFLLWCKHKWERKDQPHGHVSTLFSHVSFYLTSLSEMHFLSSVIFLLTTEVNHEFTQPAGWLWVESTFLCGLYSLDGKYTVIRLHTAGAEVMGREEGLESRWQWNPYLSVYVYCVEKLAHF